MSLPEVGGIVLLGMPGSGKGTQAVEIQKEHAIPEISTGDILRDHVHRGTDLGRLAEPIMKSGGLVPDALLDSMVAERLDQPDCAHGFILDGYPRTEKQARFLDALMASWGRRPPRIIMLHVAQERLVERLTQRRMCPQCGTIYNALLRPPKVEDRCDLDGTELIHRPDDWEDAVRHRIEVFQQETASVIAHYNAIGALTVIEADRNPAAIAADIHALLEDRMAA
jgi:adenylate kinase